jgi:hypothetical protein
MGVLSSVLVIPASIPSAFDLLIPLFLGITEFMLFGVLANQATGLTHTPAVVHYWFLSFTIFSLFSVVGILRGDWLSARGLLASDAENIRKLHRLLMRDVLGVGFEGIIAIFGFTVTSNGKISPFSYVVASILIVGLSAGLQGHAKTALLIKDAIHS